MLACSRTKLTRQHNPTNTEGLTQADGSCLSDGFVRQSTRAGNNADLARGVDVAGYDANPALARLDVSSVM